MPDGTETKSDGYAPPADARKKRRLCHTFVWEILKRPVRYGILMSAAIPDRWITPNWCKPFGADSERRERLALVDNLADQVALFPVRHSPAPASLVQLFKRSAPGHDLNEPNYGRTRRPVVSVKSYAHDRLVLSAYLQPATFRGKQTSLQNLRRGLVGERSLELPRETRRGMRVGNRWRNPPLPTRFTSNARNYVRDVAHIAEHDFDGQGCFLTLTYPGGRRVGFQTMGVASGYAVDRFNRWLRYKVKGGIFAYVWEVQKRGAPHLHYVFRVGNEITRRDFCNDARLQWYKILCDISDQTWVDLFQRRGRGSHRGNPDVLQVDCRPLDGTYARYISKYMTKTETKTTNKFKWFPGRWWGVSYEGRKAAQRLRLDSLIGVQDEHGAFTSLQLLSTYVQPLAISLKWYSRCPGGAVDSVSIQCGTGAARLLHLCIRSVFTSGDYVPLLRFLNKQTALIERTQLERKELHEHSLRKLCAQQHEKEIRGNLFRPGRDGRSKTVGVRHDGNHLDRVAG